MLNFLPGPLLGLVAFLLLLLNILIWVPLLLAFAIVRLIEHDKTDSGRAFLDWAL